VIKLIFVALWACAITLISSWAVVSWKTASATEKTAELEKFSGGLEHVKTRMISVPVIAGGAVQGYVVAQFAFNVDAKLMKRLSIKPDVILLDEAFKTIYAGEGIDFGNLKKQDLPNLLSTIGSNVNQRFGMPVVADVLIQELNYLPKAETRASVRQ
jgi:hypothetical protein